MPEAIGYHSACAVAGLIYVIGGQRNSDIVVTSVHSFHPATNAWSTVAPMLSPRVGFTTFVLGGSIYAAGGYDGSSLLSSVERYDVASDNWEVVSDMALSTARADFGAQVMRLEVGLFDSLETKARVHAADICRGPPRRRTSSARSRPRHYGESSARDQLL
jgi:hypothetical protein